MRREASRHQRPASGAINDAVEDFITRKDNPRLVCFHVPVIGCEVLMFASGKDCRRLSPTRSSSARLSGLRESSRTQGRQMSVTRSAPKSSD